MHISLFASYLDMYTYIILKRKKGYLIFLVIVCLLVVAFLVVFLVAVFDELAIGGGDDVKKV